MASPTDRERPALSEATPNDLKPWPFFGWAPGNYMHSCGDCGRMDTADKRAIRCLECAVIASKRASPNPALTQGGVVELVERLRAPVWIHHFADFPRLGPPAELQLEAATAIERLAGEDQGASQTSPVGRGDPTLAIPEGWRLVPEEPTEAMLAASWAVTQAATAESRMAHLLGTSKEAHAIKAAQRYRAMTAAAPIPPENNADVQASMPDRRQLRDAPLNPKAPDHGLYDELMQSFADPYVNDLTFRAATEIARLEEALSPPSPDAEALAELAAYLHDQALLADSRAQNLVGGARNRAIMEAEDCRGWAAALIRGSGR